MNESSLIFQQPIMFLPRLAKKLGMNGAIVFQKIHFLMNCPDNGKSIDGVKWIYNTSSEWIEKYFEFWSENTLERTLLKLENAGLIRSIQPERAKSRRKYYTITEYGYEFISSNGGKEPCLTSTQRKKSKQNQSPNLIPSESTNLVPSESTNEVPSYTNNYSTTIKPSSCELFGMSLDDMKCRENREKLVTKQKANGSYDEGLLLKYGVTDDVLCDGVTMTDMYVYFYLMDNTRFKITDFPDEAKRVLELMTAKSIKEFEFYETYKKIKQL